MQRSELLDSFLQEAEEVLGEIDLGLAQVERASDGQEALNERTMTQLSILSHRLRGSSALYGYPQLSVLAGLMERILNAEPYHHGIELKTFHELMALIQRIMKFGIDNLMKGGTDHQLGLTFAREGGAARMQALVNSNPQAFKLRVVPHVHFDEEAEEERAELYSVEGQLRQFVQENGEVWEYFAPEVREHLGNLRQQLHSGSQRDLNVMFRAAHTIKGSSFMVGLNLLGNFAHKTEDVLGAVREDAIALEGAVLETLGNATDLMEDMLLVAEGESLELTRRLEVITDQLRALAAGEQLLPTVDRGEEVEAVPAVPQAQVEAPAPLATTIRVPAGQLESLLDQVGAVVAARARMTQTLTRMNELQEAMSASQQRFQRTVRDFEERYLNPDMVRSAEGEARPGMGSLDIGQQFAELEFDSYNDLNILSRSITELSADFSEVRRRITDAVAELQDQHELVGKLVRQLRVDLTQTSRVPFNSATTRMRRWARERQDQFDLEILGEDILVESSIAQRLAEPLMHLLTNAVHHGLGDVQSRLSAGKSARGKVRIEASEERNFLEIAVQDDGRGLNFERIRERALERGLHSAQELNLMSNDDVARLILLPGLSTAEQVGTVTGRGVGMDVVATSVRQLGGELLINSHPGQGTTFTLRLPTTQRVMDVLQVQLGREHQLGAFAVNNIITLQEISAQDVLYTEEGPMINFEGRRISVIDLREIWGVTTEEPLMRLAILNSITGPVAMRVQEFGRIEEASVTPPGNVLSQLEYLSGMALSVSGEVLPILDPAGLMRLARRPSAWLSVSDGASPQAAVRRLLLVDDSLSVRRLVGRMLERGGYQVQTANDGQEALDMIQLDSHFDAVVSDLEMPRMNGYELLSALRGRAESARLPVMIMTTRAGEKHQNLAFQMGASDYFTKPVNESLLLRRLGSLLSEAGHHGVS